MNRFLTYIVSLMPGVLLFVLLQSEAPLLLVAFYVAVFAYMGMSAMFSISRRRRTAGPSPNTEPLTAPKELAKAG